MKKNKHLIPKWDCYVIKCKQIKNKKSNSYKVISWEVTPSVSTYYGLDIVSTKGGGFTGVLPYSGRHNGEYCNPFNKNTSVIVGISQLWYSEFTLVMLQPMQNTKIIRKSNGLGEMGIYPVPHTIFSVVLTKRLMYFIDRLIESDVNGELSSTYQFANSHLWPILPNIPKGYHLVRNGTVRKGDLYWDDTHWMDCDVSFSSLKPGKRVEKHKMGYHSEKGNYTCIYYNANIIRKTVKNEKANTKGE